MQETLLRMWQLAPRFTPDGKPNALLRYAVRTAHNLAITEARRNGSREIANLAHEELPRPGRAEDPDPELGEAITGCMKELPRRPKSALRARLRSSYVSDKTLAGDLGMSTNTFFQNIRRARLALLECLQRRGFALGIKP